MAVGGAESGDGGGLGLKRISHVGELVAEIAATAPRARSGQRARQAEQ
jgi:DNA repair protein RadA/Sms